MTRCRDDCSVVIVCREIEQNREAEDDGGRRQVMDNEGNVHD